MLSIAAQCLGLFPVLVSGSVLASNARDLPFKQVAAPAADIVSGRVRLPEPAECATNSPSAMVPVEFEWTRAVGWTCEVSVPVAQAGRAAIGCLRIDSAQWDIAVRVEGGDFESLDRALTDEQMEPAQRSDAKLHEQNGIAPTGAGNIAPTGADNMAPTGADNMAPPGAKSVELRSDRSADARSARHSVTIEPELVGWSCERWDFADAPAGVWTVRIAVASAKAERRPTSGWLFMRDSSSIAIAAHTASLATLSENEIGVVAHLFDATQRVSGGDGAERATATRPLAGLARSGEVVVESASGEQHFTMFDDGFHDDGVAQDGVFGARLPRWMSGEVIARVELNGLTASGTPLLRTARLAFPVVERRTAFSGTVSSSVEDATRVRIELGALQLGPQAQLHVSTEVWGTNAVGDLVPVCWLSRMLFPEERGGEWKLPLFLDGRWIDVTHTHAPFALRNARVQDPDTHVPFDVIDWMPLSLSALPAIVGQGASAITPSMLGAPITGSSALSASWSALHAGPATPIARVPFLRTLMLVHGYCSSGSIWPNVDFTQPKLEFLDPNHNRTHDQFAQLLLAAGSTRNSFGIVGHSQGGPAALHLLTYYTSGLDVAFGGRRIQSVASPYQGTPLASLGFFTCGVNNDMTPAGSTTWLAGIPTWARAEVWYWTTSDNGSTCSALTGFLLTNPEDGTVEQFRGQLPGAHSMGHVVGWCHTTGMSYPANYTDHSRNATMNTNAAR